MLKKCKYLLFGLGLLFCSGFVFAEDVFLVPDPCVLYTGSVSGPSSINFNALDNTDNLIGAIFMGTWNNAGYSESSAFYPYYGQSTITTYEDTDYTYYGMYFPFSGCSSTCSGGSGSECPEIDINYCVENDLCPISSGSWSELVINDIVHEGKPLINISIPDYIYWDYTGNENQYDIYVGSGYDQDYIDSVLKINSYRPDNQDFTQIFVSGLTLIFPYIFVALLIVFIWKLLKRVFK